MSVVLISEPIKTVNGVLSNVQASKAQCPFEFLAADFLDKENYKINIEILDALDVPLIATVYKYSPKPDGTLFIDLGQALSEINEIFLSASIPFKIRYKETYTGFVGAETLIGPYLSVYATKQLLSEGGANMWDFVLGTDTARLLTRFIKHKLWTGFNRYYSIIIDSNFTSRTGLTQFIYVQTQYDFNGVEQTRIVSPPQEVTTVEIKQNTIKGTLYPIEGVKIRDAADTIDISEEIFYLNTTPCDNEIMVEWINSLGAWEQHLFEINQLYESRSDAGVVSKKVIQSDIATLNRTKIRKVEKWVQQIILQADQLTLDQYKGLQEINSSLGVRVWLNNTGSEWVGVIVSGQFSSEHSSKHKLHDITIQLEFPDNFDLDLALNYKELVIEELIDSDLDTLVDSNGDELVG